MKKNAPEKDTSERWLLTYSDLMNLLLILFIILYSMSKTDVAKATQVAESIRKGFSASANTSSTAQSPNSAATNSTAVNGADFSNFYDQLMKVIQQQGLQNKVDVSSDGKGVIITLKDNALYSPGSASLNTNSMNLMTSIGNLLKQVNYALILVEGHTDSDPIHTSQFQDNLQLSTERANNVHRVLTSCGLDDTKIASIGYGDTRPVATNNTAENKAKNRRVVLTIFKYPLTADEVIAASDLLNSSQLTK